MIKKIISSLLLSSTLILNSNAIQVVENIDTSKVSVETSTGFLNLNPDMIIGVVGLALLLGFVVALVVWLFNWWAKKSSDEDRKHKDSYYGRFLTELALCNMNKDSRLKSKRLWSFGIFWKRGKVYCDTHLGKRLIGYYQGEMNKKENAYLISFQVKKSIFKSIDYILVIPLNLKHLVKKNQVKGIYDIVIKCEGVDEIEQTDYYVMPLIYNDEKDKKSFIDFSDYLHEKYFETYILRDTIKENLLEYKDSMKKVVELNPSVQVDRKKQN